MKFQLPSCAINKISTLADGCVRITLDFQEMAPATMAEIFTLKNGGELLEVSTETDEPKSKSERLRAVLYRLWEQSGKEGDFSSYYSQKMEQLIESIKNKLQ